MRAAAALLLAITAACQPAASPKASDTSPSRDAPLTPEDSLARFTAARARLDAAHRAGCHDACCLRPDRRAPGSTDLQIDSTGDAARRVLATTNDPALLALALRDLGGHARRDDIPQLERMLDDSRPGDAMVTSGAYGQAFEFCPRIHWKPTTVSQEALDLLSYLQRDSFTTVASYRSWRAATPDPESTFAYWSAAFDHAPYLSAERLGQLETHDATLVARVLAARCERDDQCDVRGGFAPLLARFLPPDRALRWLTLEEHFPEWEQPFVRDRVVDALLRHGEQLLRPTDDPTLVRLQTERRLLPYQLAQLAVVRSRLRPSDAVTIWQSALTDTTLPPQTVLREMARRDPVSSSDTLMQWYSREPLPAAQRSHVNEIAILEGIAQAGPSAHPLFVRLVRSAPLSPEPIDLSAALVAAARAQGCAGLATVEVWPRYGKNMPLAARDKEAARARRAREDAVRLITECAR